MIGVKVQLLFNYERDCKEVYIAEGETLVDLMPKLGINISDDYIFVVNEALKLKDYVLKENDNVKVFPAMSGG